MFPVEWDKLLTILYLSQRQSCMGVAIPLTLGLYRFHVKGKLAHNYYGNIEYLKLSHSTL